MLSAYHGISLNHVEIEGEKYPILCDLYTLKGIQDLGYEIPEFERNLLGVEGSEIGQPRVQTILDALMLFLREGMSVYNSLHPEEMKYPEPEGIAEQLTYIYRGNYLLLAMELHKEFTKCFEQRKKKESPKRKATRKSTKSQTSTNTNT